MVHFTGLGLLKITILYATNLKVSDGSTFLLEPGIILLAEDTEGVGHSWEIAEGEKWERIYIPMDGNSENIFVSDPY